MQGLPAHEYRHVGVRDDSIIEKITIEDEIIFVNINEKKTILLQIEDEQEYGISFEISEEKIIIETTDKTYELAREEIITLFIGNKEIYVGIYEWEKNNAIITLRNNEEEIRLQIENFKQQGMQRKKTAYILSIVTLVLALIVIVMGLRILYIKKRKI